MQMTSTMVKSAALAEGADLVGIASTGRWRNAPAELSPNGIMPGAQSVIVIAVSLTDAGSELAGVDDPQKAGLGEVSGLAWKRLDHASYRIGKFIEKAGFQSLPIVCTSLWRYRPYKQIDNGNVFLPDISHIHAGAAAGLGDIGYSGLLITPEYGPRVRLATVITSAPLQPDRLYDGPPLCDRCRRCVKACREACGAALIKDIDGECVVKIENKTWRYAKINKWRCAWGEHFSLDLKKVPIPDQVSEKDVIQAIAKHDVKGWLNGRCQKFCLPPHLRQKDSSHCAPMRRKRQFGTLHEYPNHNRQVADEVKRIAFARGADLTRIVSAEDFLAATRLKLQDYLPDGQSAIVLGIDNIHGMPSEEKNMAYARADYPSMQELRGGMQDGYLAADIAQQRLVFVGLDVTRYLEQLGYSALCCIQTLGIFADRLGSLAGAHSDRRFGLLLTNAPFVSDAATDDKHPDIVAPVKEPNSAKLTAQIKALALERGADLTGIASIDRLKELHPQLEKFTAKEEDDYFIVQDVGRLSKGPFVPKVMGKNIRVCSPFDYLKNARAVIVLGMHWFDAAIDNAGRPPAEAVGPYGFSQSETIAQLDDIALDVIKQLRAHGYQAVFSYDLHGIAGQVTGSCASGRSYYGMPWRGAGLYPDATANSFAAIAAGLGELGLSGAVLTPEYGNRQRFAAIITDAPLNADPLYAGPALCRQCRQCVKACPTLALDNKETVFSIENKQFKRGNCNRLRCDWSKRYGLVGDEGPKYIGSQTDIKPPPVITRDNLCEALKQMDPLQKACLVIVEKCLAACPVGKN